MGDASREIMRQARRQVPEWTPAQVNDVLAHQHETSPGDQEIVVVDVREKHEWNEGHIPAALHVPRGFLELQIEEAVPNKAKKVVLYCAGGVRSLMAGNTLQQMGYEDIVSMAGGFGQWKASGYNFIQPRTLTEAQGDSGDLNVDLLHRPATLAEFRGQPAVLERGNLLERPERKMSKVPL